MKFIKSIKIGKNLTFISAAYLCIVRYEQKEVALFLKCASFKQYFLYVILWDRYINVLYGRIHKMLLEQYKSLQFSTYCCCSEQ